MANSKMKSPGVCIIEDGIPFCNQTQETDAGFGEWTPPTEGPCFLTLNDLQLYTALNHKFCASEEYIPIFKYPKPNTPPEITILGDNPLAIYQDEVYIDAGATAIDQEDGDLTGDIVTINPVDTSILGDYTVIYSVRDTQNLQTIVHRAVNVVEVPDTTIPVITMNGSSPVDSYIGLEYIDPGATALDDVDGDITADIVVVNLVDWNTLGTYQITYDVDDSSGNSAIQAVRTINVIEVPEWQLMEHEPFDNFNSFNSTTAATIITDPADVGNNIIEYNGTGSSTPTDAWTAGSVYNDDAYKVEVRSTAYAGGASWDYCITGLDLESASLMSGSMNNHPELWSNELYYRGFSFVNPYDWIKYTIESLPNPGGLTATKNLYINDMLVFTDIDVTISNTLMHIYYHGRSVNDLVYTDYIKVYKLI